MYLQQGTRSDLASRMQRLGETQPRPSSFGGGAEVRLGQFESVPAAAQPAQQPVTAAGLDPDVVRAVQRELAQRGYSPGHGDGSAHSITRAAVMAYEHDHGLPLTGEPSEALLKSILFGLPATGGTPSVPPSAPATEIIRTVQQSLATLGYGVRSVDGLLGEETTRAIRRFEQKQGLPQTGRISGPLLVKLSDAANRQQRKPLTN